MDNSLREKIIFYCSFIVAILCLIGLLVIFAFPAGVPGGPAPGMIFLGSVFLVSGLIAVLSFSSVSEDRSSKKYKSAVFDDAMEQFRLFSLEARNYSMYMLDPDGCVRTWNDGAQQFFGYSAKEVKGHHFSTFFSEEALKFGTPVYSLQDAVSEGKFENTCTLVRKDGSSFGASNCITALKGRNGEVIGFFVVSRDLSQEKRAEGLLQRLSVSVEQAADMVIITDRRGKVEFVNQAAESITGFSRDDFLSKGLRLIEGHESEQIYQDVLWDHVLSGRSFQKQVEFSRSDGEKSYLNLMANPITDEMGNINHVVFTGTDVSPIKHMQDQLDYATSYDGLTGLPNRNLFAERLGRDIARHRESKGFIAVLTIDIDRFKYINEIYGLDAGNNVLKQVAESLSVSVSKGDTVARLGSDEFGVILHNVERPAEVVLFAKMMMKNLPQMIISSGDEISVTFAVGIAMFPDDGGDAHILMKKADTALSWAKTKGRNNHQFYRADMNVGVSELVFMERKLVDALKNREYEISFQPYAYLSTWKIAGAEALLKWKSEAFGIVSPVKFIPLLEETGMIIDVGKWVLRSACKQIRDWSKRGITVPISVNLSPSQFRHEILHEMVSDMIEEFGIDPQLLVLEITESVFVRNLEFAVSVLEKLKELGVRISIDDFGTGYSSLSYLKQFPIDFVKIDISFIKDVTLDPDATSLVTSVINMAHSLNLRTIAEGVETEEQWKLLRLLKCDMGQGFHLSQPLSREDIEKFLERKERTA